jgi:hypothetical protein
MQIKIIVEHRGKVMNRVQKIAWFNLIVLLTALGLSAIAIGVLHFIVGLQMQHALGGFGFIGIMGFAGLSPILFKKDKGKVQCDERDLMIHRKATVVAYSIFWVLFVAAAMAPFFVLGPKGTISVKYLCAMVFGGMFTVILVQSIVTLDEYGWRNKDGGKQD